MDIDKILVVDDEEKITKVVKSYLEQDGYEVFLAYDGKQALKTYQDEELDLIVLDLMLPELTGEEVCKRIRTESDLPIIMLTAKTTEEEKITGLNIGADDYLVKPFSPRELVARVRAILRRSDKKKKLSAEILSFKEDGDELLIDTLKHKVKFRNKAIDITATEFKLLKVLAQNPGRVYSRSQLTQIIQGYNYDGYDRTIDAHVKNLRRKLNIKSDQFIKTVYGVGYKFEVDNDES
ncbi:MULTISPECIES: response regulator transcription factor [unclassified Candidatus Frackibacter]|uniref:response regulator transcription factor n=1 Tax=unclassified Candidatus Frackibacter TaxID=2648818 RepID=UPI00088AC286|nr:MULTISPECIES: response regulator transcription factor [unclassified Candidatus Frackibacter]SDC35462.1 Transcriptional regulatory protein, C terminal [Candidatus Frackibacter sp. WG11]SEM55926.1 Transcriptional regulatory protein, C terminal [Candidatus Frackibacter sp. WG12]SFL71319.1 Transcriptional regulatory protein, C terminal [Candidatus Frackibacter sp. WG13]